MALPIASRPEQITPEWLTFALASVLRTGMVREAKLEPVGTGQVGDTYRALLTLEGAPPEAPTTVIAKMPAEDETSRTTGVALRSYELECRFYQHFAANLPVRTPHCHQVLFDEETHDFVLLFEDLAPAVQGDQIEGCSVDDAALAVEEMTKLHSPHFADSKLSSFDWLNRRNPETSAQIAGIATVVLPGFIERYGNALGPELVEVYEKLTTNLASWLDKAPGPLTITHGDFRLDNLLFGHTPEGKATVAVVDFQGVSLGPGTSDLAYFLGASLLPEARRDNEDELVRIYHHAMTASGAENFSFDDCWFGYRYGTFAGMIVTLVASMMVEQTDRGDEMFIAMGSRHAQHAVDLEALELLG